MLHVALYGRGAPIILYLGGQKAGSLSAFSDITDEALDTFAPETEQAELKAERNATERTQQNICENAHVAPGQIEYSKKHGALSQRFDDAETKPERNQTQDKQC